MNYERVEVLKFGGSSVGTIDAIQNSTEVVSQHVDPKVGLIGVVSAIKGATDLLNESIDAALDSRGDFVGLINLFGQNHTEIINNLSSSTEVNASLLNLEEEIQSLKNILETIRKSGDASMPLIDRVMSAGERVNSPIVATYLSAFGVKSISIPSEMIFVTNGRFGNASPDIERTRRNIKRQIMPEIDEGKVVILGGFYGADKSDKRKVTTFGRGGSDMSATVIAEAMNEIVPVRDVYLYKGDVAGVMTADPRIVPDARMNKHMTYTQIRALSGIGGSVIHARAVDHVENIGAKLHLKNTLKPGDSGTIVDGIRLDDDPPVSAVTLLENLPFIRTQGSGMDVPGITSQVTAIIASEGRDIKAISQPLSETTIDIALTAQGSTDSLEGALNKHFRVDIADGNLREFVIGEIAAVGVIGPDVRSPEVMAKIFEGLGRASESPLNVRPGVSTGENEVSLLLYGADAKEAENVVRAIHRTIFTTH